VQVQQLEHQVQVLEASTAQAVAAQTAAYVQTYRDTKAIDDLVLASRKALAKAEDIAGKEIQKSRELEDLLQSLRNDYAADKDVQHLQAIADKLGRSQHYTRYLSEQLYEAKHTISALQQQVRDGAGVVTVQAQPVQTADFSCSVNFDEDMQVKLTSLHHYTTQFSMLSTSGVFDTQLSVATCACCR
jgi:hypothetical protein